MGIGWHRDRPVFVKVVVSLGGSATMRFRHGTSPKFDRATADLPPHLIYHLGGEAHGNTYRGDDRAALLDASAACDKASGMSATRPDRV